MQEILDGLQKKINEIQTKVNTVRQITVSPVIPLSLFLNGPSVEDALFIPQGSVTQIVVQLFDAAEATLAINIVLGERVISEKYTIKKTLLAQEFYIDIPSWAIIRAKMDCSELSARMVIGIIFKPKDTHVAKAIVDNSKLIVE